MEKANDISQLLEIMARLRDPQGGCPWDVEQNFSTIAPYTIEEAYEVADAIDRGDMVELKDELGDLLLQVVFHARMAEEAGHFDFADVVEAICDKMIRRHPHVFAGESIEDAEAQTLAWRFQIRGPVAPPGAVAILAIDDRAIAFANMWPLPRRLLAEAVNRVHAGGARAIGLDLLFLELEPSSDGNTAGPGDQALREGRHDRRRRRLS